MESCTTLKTRMLTYKEVAELCGVPVGSVYSWTSKRRIPHVRFGGRCVRFSEKEILEWIESNKKQPCPSGDRCLSCASAFVEPEKSESK